MSDIPFSGVAPLSLLIEAATVPELFKARHVLGPKLEVAEALDALDRGAVLLPDLIQEWAMYEGRMPLRAGLSGGRGHDVQMEGFHETLGTVGLHFPLEYSTPLPPRGKGGTIPDPSWGGWRFRRMRTRPSDRLQVIERTEFFQIACGQPEDVDDSAIEEAVKEAESTGNIPYFEEQSLRLGPRESVGKVWVRIAPAVVRIYRRDPATLYALIARLHAGRIAILRDRIARTTPPLKRRELEVMNAFLATEVFIQDAYDSAAVRFKTRSRRAGQELVHRTAKVVGPEGRRHRQSGLPTVFISYAHADAQHQRAIRQHLAVMEREGRARIWWDERIAAGGMWQREIAAALTRAGVVVLLVSRHFLSSTYCYEREMRNALQRAKQRKARVIPVILADCTWKTTPLRSFLALPKDGKPVLSYRRRDAAYLEIAEAIETAVNSSLESRRAPRHP